MRSFRLIPDNTHIPFVRYRHWAYAFSGALVLLTLILLPTKGLNFGIDFRGGILIEVGMPGPADLAAMRSTLGSLGLGEVALQEFGGPTNVLIRVERQAGGEQGQLAAVDEVKTALVERFGNDISYRRVEFVGPKVSEDLLWAGIQATAYAVVAILAYVWFRFEWQFAVGAVVALIHDAVTTLGVFSLFGLEFNLTTIAALLTIVGYSINDTVVIYDRIRVNAIAPGVILSERVKALLSEDDPIFKKSLLGASDPEDVAQMALYLASDESRRVTGAILPMDSGASAI